METIVQGTIGALGYLEDGVYYPEPDCIETVRDLIRFLRADGPDLMVRRCCGTRNVVGSDLIPILKTPKLKDDMFDLALRLAANLCQPSMVSLQGKAPETKEQVAMQRQLEENLTRTKLACADRGLFEVLKAKLSKFFIDTNWDGRTEEQRLVMERIVVFIRYMFSITPVDVDDKRTAFDTSSHDRLVEAAIDSGLDVLLMEISKDRRERDFHLSILEIFALMLKEHKPEDLVSADQGRSEEQKRKTEGELQQIVENQRAAMEEMKRKIMGKRHTNFAGTYEVRGLTAPISGNDRIIINKPVKDVTALEFNETRKAKKRTPKNRRPFEANQRTFLSSIEIRMKMKGFVTRLLEDCYVRLMRSTKTAAFDARRSIGQRQADLHYFLLERFCVQFARLAKMRAEKVSCSLGVDGFHHVQMQLDNYLELAKVEKKDGRRFGLRAQFALSAYKELILFHQYMMDCGTAEEKEDATSTCTHILRMDEYRDLSSKLMQGFMPGVLSKTFLRELVLVNHHYFRLLERSHKAGLLMRVTKKQRVRRNRGGGKGKKGKKGGKKDGEEAGEEMAVIGGDDDAAQRAAEREANEKLDGMKEVTAEDMWDGLEEDVRKVLKGEEEEEADVRPIEVTLEVEDDVHQRFAMLRIQRALRAGRPLTAVSLYHAARAIWPADGAFGTASMPLEEEMNEIKAILVTDLKEVATELAEAEQKMEQSMAGRRGGGGEEGEGGEEEEYDSEAEEDDARYERREVDFDFKEHVHKFARNDVLKWYIFLLADFETNPAELNHALVRMLHRVAFELDLHPRVYMVSLFMVFEKLHQKMEGRSQEDIKKSAFYEIYQFGFHLLRKFYGTFATIGGALGAEAVFWKTPQAVYEIQFGYGSYSEAKDSEKMTWTEELEGELRSHYQDYREMDERPEGMDIADYIEHSLSRERTRRQILRKMADLGLDAMGAKAGKGSVRNRQFPMIELKEIAASYEQAEDKEEGEDLPAYCKRQLQERDKGVHSRGRIVKELTYVGIVWEKKRKERPLKEWSEGLRTELAALKEQWDEEEEEEKQRTDIASYVHRRLSEKRPRREVERYLEKMGVEIVRREKAPRAPRKKKGAEKGSDGEEEEEEEEGGKSGEESEESDALMLSDEENDDGENESRPHSAASAKGSEERERTKEERRKEKEERKKEKKEKRKEKEGKKEKEVDEEKERKRKKKELKRKREAMMMQMVAKKSKAASEEKDEEEDDELKKADSGEEDTRSSGRASAASSAAPQKEKDDDEEEEAEKENTVATPKSKRRRVMSSSDEEEGEEQEEDTDELKKADNREEDTRPSGRASAASSAAPQKEIDDGEEEAEEKENTVATPKSKRRRVMSSSDEEEGEEQEKDKIGVDTVDVPAPEARKHDDDVPDLAPSKKMRRLIMSDDEDD